MTLERWGSIKSKGKHKRASLSPQIGVQEASGPEGISAVSSSKWGGKGGVVVVERTTAPSLASVFSTSCPNSCYTEALLPARSDSWQHMLISWGMFDPSARLHSKPAESVCPGVGPRQQMLSFPGGSRTQPGLRTTIGPLPLPTWVSSAGTSIPDHLESLPISA